MQSKCNYQMVVIAFTLALLFLMIPARPISAFSPTTSVTLIRMSADGVTPIMQEVLTYQEMESKLPVYGDGTTHYYLQGPVFLDDPNPDNQTILRWNQAEDTNLKDYGAVKGTNLKDLCDLIGGMSEGQELQLRATDNVTVRFAYKNVYHYSDREGPMVLTWYNGGKYPDSGYTEGMRIIWFADTSVNPWSYHAFGAWDWHQAADEKYWYYYSDGAGKHPDTTGLSIFNINQITIYSSDPPWYDLNGDRKCDAADIVKLGLKWGQTGPPGWIPEDVNKDGIINILDAAKLGQYWGKSY